MKKCIGAMERFGSYGSRCAELAVIVHSGISRGIIKRVPDRLEGRRYARRIYVNALDRKKAFRR